MFDPMALAMQYDPTFFMNGLDQMVAAQARGGMPMGPQQGGFSQMLSGPNLNPALNPPNPMPAPFDPSGVAASNALGIAAGEGAGIPGTPGAATMDWGKIAGLVGQSGLGKRPQQQFATSGGAQPGPSQVRLAPVAANQGLNPQRMTLSQLLYGR